MNSNNLKFVNLSRHTIICAHDPEPSWQREIMDKVSAEYSDQARKVNADFRRAVLSALADEKKLAGRAVAEIERNTPRLVYIKNIDAPDGSVYDAEVDLLRLTVDFIKH